MKKPKAQPAMPTSKAIAIAADEALTVLLDHAKRSDEQVPFLLTALTVLTDRALGKAAAAIGVPVGPLVDRLAAQLREHAKEDGHAKENGQ